MSIIVYPCLVIIFTTLTCKGSNGYREYAAIQNNNGIEVSSIAGYTSNDQIVSNVKFYSTPGISIVKNGDSMSYTYPINNNRGITTGSIQVKPGSIAVSSSTYSKSPSYNWPNIPRLDPIRPMFDNFIFPPIKFYQPTNIDWFDGNMKNRLDRLKPVLRNPFMHQNLDRLLNLWQ